MAPENAPTRSDFLAAIDVQVTRWRFERMIAHNFSTAEAIVSGSTPHGATAPETVTSVFGADTVQTRHAGSTPAACDPAGPIPPTGEAVGLHDPTRDSGVTEDDFCAAIAALIQQWRNEQISKPGLARRGAAGRGTAGHGEARYLRATSSLRRARRRCPLHLARLGWPGRAPARQGLAGLGSAGRGEGTT